MGVPVFPYENRPELDRWIISRYNELVANVTVYGQIRHMKTVRAINDFVVEDYKLVYKKS